MPGAGDATANAFRAVLELDCAEARSVATPQVPRSQTPGAQERELRLLEVGTAAE